MLASYILRRCATFLCGSRSREISEHAGPLRFTQNGRTSILENRPELTTEQLTRTVALMDAAVPDAQVTSYESLIDGLTLPDANDRHVLAAAIRCSASVIVTFNEKDFPALQLAPFGIEAQHPDAFIEYLFDLDSAAVVNAARKQRANLANPVLEVDQFLDILRRQGLVQTVRSLMGYHAIL